MGGQSGYTQRAHVLKKHQETDNASTRRFHRHEDARPIQHGHLPPHLGDPLSCRRRGRHPRQLAAGGAGDRSRPKATNAKQWAGRFYALLDDFRFLPGGRILAGAGTGHRVTLFNCFVMGEIADDLEHIFEALKEGALTMQQGGGVGYDFSTLRPAGMVAAATGSIASGPVSFMRIWDAMCATMLSTGARRGAMMATLRCDHPDIETFVDAKRDPALLRHFNLSVLVSDAFMAAVADDGDWPLLFPGLADARTLKARDLWQRILRAAYDTAEPGVLFVDTINRDNTLADRETLSATNPCGEIPLPPYGACDLGSLNLTAFVTSPFAAGARLDLDALAESARLAVRFLDNVIDVSRYPLPAQEEQARLKRRVGLGITGLADALVLLGLRYDSEAARTLAARAMQTMRDAAYRASIDLAREKGAFPAFARDAFLASGFARRLPADIREAIAAHGLRNSHLIGDRAGRHHQPAWPTTVPAASNRFSPPRPSAACWERTAVIAPTPWWITPVSCGSSRAGPARHPPSLRHGSSIRSPICTCRPRCSPMSTTPFQRPSTSPPTCRSSASRTSTSRRMRWVSRAAPCSGPTPSPAPS